MRQVLLVLSGLWSFGWMLGHQFGWDTLLAATFIVVGSACAVFMV